MDELILGFEQFGLRNLKEEMQKILSDQSKLKEEMQKNLRDQSKINERIQQLFTRIQNANTTNTSMFFDDKTYFPLDNYDNLKNMENIISKNIAAGDEFESLLVKELSLVGGNDVDDMVRRLMNKLFTKELLSGYTRTGRGNTLKFSDLKIHDVIFATIAEKFSNTDTTRKLFEKAISYNLQRAKDH